MLEEIGPKVPLPAEIYPSSSLVKLALALLTSAEEALMRGGGTKGPRRGQGWKRDVWAREDWKKMMTTMERMIECRAIVTCV